MMNNDMSELTLLARLHRILGRPKVSNYQYTCDVVCTPSIFELLNSLLSRLNGNNGSIEIELNTSPFTVITNDSNDESLFDVINKDVSITIFLRQNGSDRFYLDCTDLVDSRGMENEFSFPENYYLIDEDYCNSIDGDNARPKELKVIDSIALLAINLRKIADKIDVRLNGSTATYFIQGAGESSSITPMDVNLTINHELLNLPLTNFTIFNSIDDSSLSTHHAYEKKMLLKTAIYEILKDNSIDNNLTSIVNLWEKIDTAYHNNLEVFITGISFSKLRHEVEERSIEEYDKLNTALADISLKLAAIPLSFGLWIFAFRSEHSLFKMFGFLLAIILITVILRAALSGYIQKLKYLKNIIDKQMELFKSKLSVSVKDKKNNSDISETIVSTEGILNERYEEIERWLGIYSYILWIPVVIMVLTVGFQVYSKI